MKIRSIFVTGILIFSISLAVLPAQVNASNYTSVSQSIFASEKFYRAELYFGMNIPGGGTVSENDWNKFLNEEVTPKFPDGFTVIEAGGQYKDKSGQVVKEKSRVLILLYPKKIRKDVNAKLEAIRVAYVKNFQQESVLRMDFTQTVIVSF